MSPNGFASRLRRTCRMNALLSRTASAILLIVLVSISWIGRAGADPPAAPTIAIGEVGGSGFIVHWTEIADPNLGPPSGYILAIARGPVGTITPANFDSYMDPQGHFEHWYPPVGTGHDLCTIQFQLPFENGACHPLRKCTVYSVAIKAYWSGNGDSVMSNSVSATTNCFDTSMPSCMEE